MSTIAYFEGRRLHIRDYNPQIHQKVYCADGHLLIAKKGAIKQHHFAHRAGEGKASCGSEGKTEWHLYWQLRLLPANIELKFIRPVDGVETMKIADSINVIGENKDVLSIVEFQNSVMAASEISFREAFYTRDDLMIDWGVPKCKAELTWIFNLESCDLEVEEVFGDLVCFKWLKGTKYMLASKCRTFFDVSKQELILCLAVHKPETQSTKFIGRLIPLREIDRYFFTDALCDLNEDQKRSNRLHVTEFNPLSVPVERTSELHEIIELTKAYYFKHYGKSKGKTMKKEIKDKLATFQKKSTIV